MPQDFAKRITDAFEAAIEELTPDFKAMQEPELVALAEDMLWGQESALGEKIGNITTEWLLSIIEEKSKH
jgi:hypothetical protein